MYCISTNSFCPWIVFEKKILGTKLKFLATIWISYNLQTQKLQTPETFAFVKDFQIKMNIIITDCLFCSVGALNDCS